MKKSAVGIVEELTEQGCTINEALKILTEAKYRVKSIRKFMDTRAGETLLKDAFSQQEDFMEGLRKSMRG